MLICSIGVTLLINGCTNPFNPDVIKNTQSNEVHDNTTPRNVLKNLETAYNQQDLELYMSCLSTSFRFELISVEIDEIGIDMDGDGIKDSWWDYDKEVEYHRNLFRDGSSDGRYPSPDNIYLNLQIPHEDAWLTDNQQGREDWIIIPAFFNLAINIYGTSNITAEGYARFYLRPEGNEWRVIIWRDESNL